MSDYLVEIKRIDWPVLKDLYASNGERSNIASITIENYIRWFEQDSKIKHVKFFCLNGDFSDGTFVVTDQGCAYADTNNNDYDKLYRLVSLLNFSNGFVFLSIRDKIKPVILNAIKHKGGELTMNDTTLLYYCPKEVALQFSVEVPNDIELRELTELSHLEKANSVWPKRNPNSLAFFQRIAKYNVNIGAFKSNGTLVAWVFRLPTGHLTALQTDADHFGHGYGTLVVKYVSKEISEMGHDIYAGVNKANHPSRQLFEKTGFKSMGQVHWIGTKFNWIPDDE